MEAQIEAGAAPESYFAENYAADDWTYDAALLALTYAAQDGRTKPTRPEIDGAAAEVVNCTDEARAREIVETIRSEFPVYDGPDALEWPAAQEFRLEIALGNDAMRTPEDIAAALSQAAATLNKWSDFHHAGQIIDANGNQVGTYWTEED